MDPHLPQLGDVIISKLYDPDSTTPYAVGPFGGPVQYLERTHNLARACADRYARSTRVDVWFTEDGEYYSSVARFRSS